LRLQRGLKQGDFIPLTAKTIARIERSEVGKPHGKTLQIISQRLGVNADQIESY
jgi:transcriptional regulator with XRE-family HTH domain